MCNIFAGQDPATYACVTRSMRLSGHVTSIRLEAQFWGILDEIARYQGLTTPRFVSKLYDEALEIHGEVGNFTSLLRNACVIYLRQPQHVPGARDLLESARKPPAVGVARSGDVVPG